MAGRKPKPEGDRKADQLRIPLTATQKEAIRTAAEHAGAEMTSWARETLLKAAARAQKQS